MQLLYLWIEDYKNIKQQGFNFSPLYDFHFEPDKPDENGKIISGTLTDKITKEEREKKADFYEDFFGKGISNVTAIVGENGAGKSSVGNVIINILNRKYDYKDNYFVFCIFKQSTTNKEIANYKYILNKDIKVNTTNLEYKIEQIELADCREEISPLFYNNQLDLSYEKPFSDNELSPINDVINSIKERGSKNLLINFGNNIYYLRINRKINFFRFIKNNNITIRQLKLPKYFYLMFKTNNVLKTPNIFSKKFAARNQVRLAILNKIDIKKSADDDFIKRIETETDDNFIKTLEELLDKGLKIGDGHYLGKVSDASGLKKLYINLYKNVSKNKILSVSDKFLYELIDIMYEYKDDFIKTLDFIDFIWLDDDEKDSYLKLSEGEEAMWNQLSSFLEYKINEDWENKNTMFYTKDQKNQLIAFIDEGELGLHPQWQKQYLKILLETLPKIFPDKEIQLILTSHSPFLVSDLPKENVIFLEKEENTGLCKVSKLDSMKETFGANIHTLLTDSFFMKGGLVGEFAQSKIDEAIDILNKSDPKKEDLDKCEMIISMIGEPIVKTMLRKLLDSKRLRKVDEHSIEIEKLRKRIEKLEKNNNNTDS